MSLWYATPEVEVFPPYEMTGSYVDTLSASPVPELVSSPPWTGVGDGWSRGASSSLSSVSTAPDTASGWTAGLPAVTAPATAPSATAPAATSSAPSTSSTVASTSTSRTRKRRQLTTPADANHECALCGKLFGRSYNFKAHMETHDPARAYPHPCRVAGCVKKFVRKTDLTRHHQSVHMKQRNYKCHRCGNLFARKDTLRRHTEDGCPKRFEVTAAAASTQASPHPPVHTPTPSRSNSLTHSLPELHTPELAPHSLHPDIYKTESELHSGVYKSGPEFLDFPEHSCAMMGVGVGVGMGQMGLQMPMVPMGMEYW